jgi:hypothetical protein
MDKAQGSGVPSCSPFSLPASHQSGVATSSSPFQSHSHADKEIAALLIDPEQDPRVNMPARLGAD